MWLKWFWKDIQFHLGYDLWLPHGLVYPIRAWQDRQVIKAFPAGILIEDCSYHPCVVIETDGDGDITTFDLALQRGGGGCSLFHCGIVELSLQEVHRLLDLYKQGGDRALMADHGWSADDIEKFYQEWRS
jgi:hypothetical protein